MRTKQIARSLVEVMETPEMKLIVDKTKDMDEIINEIISWWNYDLFKRKPGPAYTNDGLFQGTDLDLACFLYALVDRNAVINIPKYKGLRNTTIKENQILTSSDNRHGQLLGINANKETFLFSIRIKDMNVITSESVGDYRNFTLTDFDGEWYKEWNSIQFMPNAKENNFITENNLYSNQNQIIFKNFISPNRWISLYGQPYFITKALIQRLEEEAQNLNLQIKNMIQNGIKYPQENKSEFNTSKTTVIDKGKSIKVNSFEVEIDLPENNTEFKIYDETQENLIEITNKRKYYIYHVIPRLRFATRSTEFAYHKYGKDKFPSWIKNAKWEDNYKQPGKRKEWKRLILFQPGVGKVGVSIRTREYVKSEKVSSDYKE